MSESVYQISRAHFRYRGAQPLLEGVDFTVAAGDFVGLIGPNGVGKSTLLHLMTGLLSPTDGTVQFLGRPLHSWSRRDLARHVAVVPQREEAAFDFTVLEMVLMGRFARQGSALGFDNEEDLRIAREALERVCLSGFERRGCRELSGGERQRLLVARALAQEAPIILLDEPTSSLDLGHQRMLFALLQELNRERQTTIVAVSHDINLAGMYCRDLAVLHRGRITARGTPSVILRRELLEPVYSTPLELLTTGAGNPIVVPQP